MPKLTDFKALLFDVDNTLTNSARDVTPRTQVALTEIAKAGYKIGLCTGRSYNSLRRKVLAYFPQDSLHIVSGGAQVITADGTVKWEKTIPPETAKRIAQYAEEFHIACHLPDGDFSYANAKMMRDYKGVHALVPDMKPLSELQNWAAPIIPTLDVTEEFLAFLRTQPDISVKETISYRGQLAADITAKDVTKATGLLEWTNLKGITPDQIIGFGDSDNDVEYLEAVSWAVALGNSTIAIKNIADRVIGDTNDEGLAEYLENIYKGAEL